MLAPRLPQSLLTRNVIHFSAPMPGSLFALRFLCSLPSTLLPSCRGHWPCSVCSFLSLLWTPPDVSSCFPSQIYNTNLSLTTPWNSHIISVYSLSGCKHVQTLWDICHSRQGCTLFPSRDKPLPLQAGMGQRSGSTLSHSEEYP